jgi:hypothetical protein
MAHEGLSLRAIERRKGDAEATACECSSYR